MGYVMEKWERKLKPCPFCGRDTETRDEYAPLYIEVTKDRLTVVCACGCTMTTFIKPISNCADDLVEKWNRRES